MIEAALAAGKHVLSQKPFVLDLDAGARLCDLADAKGVRLAVNQNGRWAPHLAWMREAVRAGLIGAVQSLRHLDPLGPRLDRRHAVRGDRRPDPLRLRRPLVRLPGEPRRAAPTSVFAARAPRRRADGARRRCSPQALVAFDGGQAALAFDGATRFGAEDRTFVGGSAGTLVERGPRPRRAGGDARDAPAGIARPQLEGTWFSEGFVGTMGELLSASRTARAAERRPRQPRQRWRWSSPPSPRSRARRAGACALIDQELGRGRSDERRPAVGALGPHARPPAGGRAAARLRPRGARASAWRISASAPSTAATRPNTPTTCSSRRFDRWGVVGINIRDAARSPIRSAGRPASTPACSARASGSRRASSAASCRSSTARRARRRRSRCSPSPEIDVVTLTVTEKGYCHQPGERRARPGPARHRPRPRQSRGAAQPARPARCGRWSCACSRMAGRSR